MAELNQRTTGRWSAHETRAPRVLALDRARVAAIGGGIAALWLLAFTAGWLLAMAPRNATVPNRVADGARTPRAAAAAAIRDGAMAIRGGVLDALSFHRPAPAAGSLAALPVYEFRLITLPPRPQAHGEYGALISAAALRHALSPALIEAVMRVESDFNPAEVSDKGAVGIMQVIPATGARFGVTRAELFDPERNIAAGTAYLAWLQDRYHGDLDRVLAAYNAGEGAVERYGGIPPYRETQQYVQKVRAELSRLEPRVR